MRRVSLGIVAGMLLLVACGSTSEHGIEVVGSTEVAVSDAWARPTPVGVTNSAVYMVVESPVDDQLISASVDPSVAASASLHETMVMATSGDDHDKHGDGMASMHPRDAVDLPARSPVTFEPGGLHVMLTDLVKPLTPGDRFPLTLRFATAPPLTVTVKVRDE